MYRPPLLSTATFTCLALTNLESTFSEPNLIVSGEASVTATPSYAT
ncbi:MAG: hypothetical protein PHZ02_14380 [Desulfocapsaceae bacterium]|nr:hypothetical protein [Desulfocapsaceae bacterium]